jgi:hypothetical protein
MCVQSNTATRSYSYCCSGNAMSITYCECVFVAFKYLACNTHAPHCHLWPARTKMFPHYLINGTIFRGVFNIKCVVLISSTTFSVTFLVLRRTERDVVNVYWSAVQCPLVLSYLNETRILSTDFAPKYSNIKFH